MQTMAKHDKQDWLSNLFKHDLTTNGWNVADLLPVAANDDQEEVELLDGELAYWLIAGKKRR